MGMWLLASPNFIAATFQNGLRDKNHTHINHTSIINLFIFTHYTVQSCEIEK